MQVGNEQVHITGCIHSGVSARTSGAWAWALMARWGASLLGDALTRLGPNQVHRDNNEAVCNDSRSAERLNPATGQEQWCRWGGRRGGVELSTGGVVAGCSLGRCGGRRPMVPRLSSGSRWCSRPRCQFGRSSRGVVQKWQARGSRARVRMGSGSFWVGGWCSRPNSCQGLSAAAAAPCCRV
jgi:hypothetical protein